MKPKPTVHQIHVCNKEKFELWKNNALIFVTTSSKFITYEEIMQFLPEEIVKYDYQSQKSPFYKDYDDLEVELKIECAMAYAKKNKYYSKETLFWKTYKEYFIEDLNSTIEHEPFYHYGKAEDGIDVVFFGHLGLC